MYDNESVYTFLFSFISKYFVLLISCLPGKVGYRIIFQFTFISHFYT